MNFSIKRFRFWGVIALSLFVCLASCRKKGDNEKLTGENQNAPELMPTDSGSWWLMKDNNGEITITTATGRDSFIENNTYEYYEMRDTGTGAITPYFYAKNDGYYLSLPDITGQGDFIPTIICTVNPKVGDTWTNTSLIHYSGIPVSIKSNGKVVTTTGSLTINGHTYQNVVETENDLKAKPSFSPVWMDAGTLTIYFVSGIGIIKNDLDVDVSGVFQTYVSDELLDYHIE